MGVLRHGLGFDAMVSKTHGPDASKEYWHVYTRALGMLSAMPMGLSIRCNALDLTSA